MVDVIILRRKNFAIVIPETEKGRVWLSDNLTGVHSATTAITIQNDLASDFELDLKAAGLDVEIK